jgi:hypothetical protein
VFVRVGQVGVNVNKGVSWLYAEDIRDRASVSRQAVNR